jgi:hypothetical protein
MAQGNIETFTDNVKAPVADSAGSTAYEQLGRHVEAAYAQAGHAVAGAVGTIGNTIDEHETLVETSKLTNDFADLEMQTAQNLEKSKTSMDPHDTDAASNFLSAHEATLANIGDGLITDKGKAMYNSLAANYKVNTFNKVIGYQSAAAADSVITNFKSGFDTRANLAEADPTSVASSISALQASALGMPAEHRDSILKQGMQQVADSGAEGLVNKLLQNPNAKPADVEAARSYLNNPDNPFVANMSPGQYASVNARLDRIKDTQGNVQSVIAAQTLTDGYKQLEQNGGVDKGGQWQAIITGYQGKTADATAEFKAKNQRDYDAAIATGQATFAVKSTPDQDLKGDILDLKAKMDNAPPEQTQKLESEYKAVVEAKKVRDEAFTKDPADWVNNNNDVVKARYTAFAQNPSTQSFQAYATASVAEQKRLYPLATPKLVSNEMADTISGAVGKITNDPQGASAAAGTLSSYANTAGAYWPQMSQELYHRKVLNPTQFVAASLYGKPNGTGLAEEMLRASTISEKELSEKNIGNPNVTAAKARAAANQAFAPLARTLVDDRAPDSIVGAYEQGLTNVLLNRGNVSDAPGLASKIINDEYAFKGTYRVPNSARVNADDVDAGLKSSLGNVQTAGSGIGGANLIVPKSYSGLGPDDQKRAYVANIQRQGHWVTNSTETGAVLYDEQGSPVWQRGPSGQPQMVGVDWKTAASQGVQARGITGKAYKFIMGQQ